MSKPYDFEYQPLDDDMGEPTNPRTGHHRDCLCSLCTRDQHPDFLAPPSLVNEGAKQ